MKRKNVVLKWGSSLAMLCLLLFMATIGANAQQRTITGKVADDKGFPLPGVTVIVKGTTLGTVTNFDGNFTLSVPASAVTLQFSFVGMKAQEVAIEGKTSFSITMIEESIGLEEVVAVGYGTQKKETLVGSIAQVTNEELKRTGNVTDLRQALMGQMPGVVALTTSGEPGGILQGESATNIFIRGQNTWNGGQPLVLVDGVERNMNNVDVNEVETISVLKDASATAVFGVKGANGVILITTKRGTESKTKLNFNYIATSSICHVNPKSSILMKP
jgi:TonB-dependent SusC/RagA subfamily outer membrane receptor